MEHKSRHLKMRIINALGPPSARLLWFPYLFSFIRIGCLYCNISTIILSEHSTICFWIISNNFSKGLHVNTVMKIDWNISEKLCCTLKNQYQMLCQWVTSHFAFCRFLFSFKFLKTKNFTQLFHNRTRIDEFKWKNFTSFDWHAFA